ncbi:hypothetical protein MASR1M32_16300 [Rhodobacter sp.]
MTHSDQAEVGTGVGQAATSPSPPVAAGRAGGTNLAKQLWWGAIVALVSILFVTWLVGRQQHGAAGAGDAAVQAETIATTVEKWLRTAENTAEEVELEIGPMLEQAYAPVYESIPSYMDFHYSLKGEWLELSAAALGDIGQGLEKHLFAGHELRLSKASDGLIQDYTQRYDMALSEAMAASPGDVDALPPVLKKAVSNAKTRIKRTAKVFAGTAVSGASLAVFVKVFANKLATKLAAKVAAKTGTKWAAGAGGAGVGAAACSWTGPGAAGCAVVGAVVTWVAVDLAVLKLDEYVTRDEFERDLRALIDEHKEETRRALQKGLEEMANAAHKVRRDAVQEVALSDLKDADRTLACSAATEIQTAYEALQQNLQARSPANLEILRLALANQVDNQLLAPWVDELGAMFIDKDLRLWINKTVTLSVDLPEELQENHNMRATLILGATSLEFDWTEGASAGHYILKAALDGEILMEGPQKYELELVQDRGLVKFNRSFNGTVRFDVFKAISEKSGLAPSARVSAVMFSDNAGEKLPTVTLALPIEGVKLPEVEMPEFCTH